MATITWKGNPIHTSGTLPSVGSKAPQLTLTRKDLSDATLETYAGKRKVLNIFPSIDTPVCALSVKSFNTQAASKKNTVVLNIAADLPFALKRFCAAEGIENVEALSTFRSSFAKDWGVAITDSGLAGLCSRAVVVLDENNTVIYTEQVPDIAQEPNYAKALATIS